MDIDDRSPNALEEASASVHLANERNHTRQLLLRLGDVDSQSIERLEIGGGDHDSCLQDHVLKRVETGHL